MFLVDILILLVASHCPASWQGEHRIAFWVGVGLAVLVTVLSLVTHHGLTVTSGLATWLWDWSADAGTALTAGCTPALDHQRRNHHPEKAEPHMPSDVSCCRQRNLRDQKKNPGRKNGSMDVN